MALGPTRCVIILRAQGEVPERLNGTVSKTVVAPVATVGSNPTSPQARKMKSLSRMLLGPTR